MTAAVPDPRDDLITGSSIHIHGAGESCSPRCITPAVPLGDRVYTAWTGQPDWGGCDQRESVERVLDVIAAEMEARVQAVQADLNKSRASVEMLTEHIRVLRAAANQRAVEELEALRRELHVDPVLRAAYFASYVAGKVADHAAALASPAPAPRAESTGELREQLTRWAMDRFHLSEVHGLDAADALLSGPLAPPLAKLRAVEAERNDARLACTRLAMRAANAEHDLSRALGAS